MSSVNISIREEAYNFLSSLRSKNESFSEIILGFKNKKKGNPKEILNFFDSKRFPRPKVDWNDKEKRMKDFRESFNKRHVNDMS